MKNKIEAMHGIAIIAIVAVIGAVLAGCASMTLVSVDTVEGPARVRQGQDINPNEITVMGIYKDDSRKRVTVRSGDITFDKNTTGSKTVRVRVSGKEASFQTEVMPLSSLTVSRQPTTTAYKLGVLTDVQRPGGPNPPPDYNYVQLWTGLEVQGTWDQMGSAPIDIKNCTITGFNRNQAGRQTVTVSYLGKTTAFNVEVITLSSIRVATPPTKTTYVVGESINQAGISVIATWSNNSTETIAAGTAGLTFNFDSSTAGTKTVTVTYGGKTATFNVTVIAVNSIAITRPPTKTTYNAGETLNLAGLVVTATYSNGTSGQVTIANSNVSGFSTATAGTKTLTVTYGGKTATFNITVAASINGTWVRSPYELTYNNGNFEQKNNGELFSQGTYTIAGSTLTLTLTRVAMGTGAARRLYSRGELNPTNFRALMGGLAQMSDAEVNTTIDAFFKAETMSFSLSGNTLTLIREGLDPQVYTKR